MNHPAGAPPLELPLLESLADRWQGAGLPILERLLPGLTDDEIDAVVGPLGLDLPAEARTWWGWHNGAAKPKTYAKERFVSPGLEFLSLSEAVDVYREDRSIFEDFDDGPDYWWPPSQLVLFSRDQGTVTFDCDATNRTRSPLYFSDHFARSPEKDFSVPVARSFGEMVTWWIEAWDEGLYAYDAEEDRFSVDLDRLDRARERSGLM